MTHSTAGRVVWKSRRIVGIATVSTELSSTTMSAATTTTASVIHRRGSGTPAVVWGDVTSRGLSAVDHELGAGGVRVVVGHQPQRELGDLLRLRVPLQWHADDRRRPVEIGAAHHRRVDDPGVDRVDLDPVWAELDCGALGHAAHRPLGGRVGKACARAAQATDRRDVDDRTGTLLL